MDWTGGEWKMSDWQLHQSSRGRIRLGRIAGNGGTAGREVGLGGRRGQGRRGSGGGIHVRGGGGGDEGSCDGAAFAAVGAAAGES